MENLRDVYAQKAISQIPRLLSLEDRNEFSKTYGCFNREYWLTRSLDFPNAIKQFGVHSLALVYANEFPNNIYYQHPKILDWTLAGVDYWIKIQKPDGSFDEFYPNERGWAGPTGFLLYAMMDTYRMLKDKFPRDLEERFLKAAHKAATFLAKYDEPGVLANHHAMAILPIYEAYAVLQDKKLLDGFHVRLDDFLSYCYDEGWCLEYDGADLGYLSATVSFLGKLWNIYQDERIYKVIQKAIEFSSYFVYPNGFYAGTIGSRQTLHFYPHGYEIFSQEIPLAAAVADKMLIGLKEGKLVPPEIQADRYFLYRIPELLQAYLDYKPRSENLPKVPHEREPFDKYYEGAKIFIKKTPNYYLVVNLAKGGVTKLFNLETKKLVFNDCGIISKLSNGKVISSQWIDADYQISSHDSSLSVEGNCHYVVSKVFTPFKMILFRLGMLTLGWHTKLAYKIKGWIRKILMLGSKPAPAKFRRNLTIDDENLILDDEITLTGSQKIEVLKIGDEFTTRYVPQSRYFQSQELDVKGYYPPQDMIDNLNQSKRLCLRRVFSLEGEALSVEEIKD